MRFILFPAVGSVYAWWVMKNRIFSLFILLGLASAPNAFSQQDRSLDQGGQQVKLTVQNNTKQNVVVAWVNFEGQMESYGSLAPGQSYQFDTFPGHLWKFGVGNQLFGSYRATGIARQTYAINAQAAQTMQPPAQPTQPTSPQRPPTTGAATAPAAPAAAPIPAPMAALLACRSPV